MLTIYIAALGAALAAVLARGAGMFISGIHAEKFMLLIKKLVNAGNSDRALKICAAAPKSMIGNISAAVLRESLNQDSNSSIAEVGRQASQEAIAAYSKYGQLPYMALGLAAVAMSLPGAETGLSLAVSMGPPAGVALVAILEILAARKNIKLATLQSEDLVSLMIRRQDEQGSISSGDRY